MDRWEGDETLQILLRVGSTNQAVAERMRSIFTAQLIPVASALTSNSLEAAKRASLASSQILGVALCRFVLAFPPMMKMSSSPGWGRPSSVIWSAHSSLVDDASGPRGQVRLRDSRDEIA
ncbi:hypothetical protein GCM10020216_030440 [Nonomuraea helvata]